MSNPHVPFDPDPLTPAEYRRIWIDGYDAGRQDAPRPVAKGPTRGEWAAVVLATFALLVSAFFFGRASAAPRSATTVIPTGTPNGSAPVDRTPVPSGNPSSLTGAPPGQRAELVGGGATSEPVRGQPGGAPSPTIAVGVASYVRRGLGDRYLALPAGPGVRVRICSSSTRCLVRTSTDAGPDLAMQRRGRVADLSFVDFAWLCRCDPPRVGLIHVTVEDLRGPRITPPPTDVRR